MTSFCLVISSGNCRQDISRSGQHEKVSMMSYDEKSRKCAIFRHGQLCSQAEVMQ
jgi:hypothetical protein